ncbi:MAG: D-alanyl-D-alanine carboxypeptidase family protein [Thermoleophilia bacterium]|nr:D-alanyl-D-alanine carboxypeptidase family protein [Thermoleophilia bacterium]
MRPRCDSGQALPLALGLAGVLLVLTFGLLQVGRAHLAAAQAQTAADLTALAAARDISGGRPADLTPLARHAIEARAAEVASGSGARLRRLRLPRGSDDSRREVEVIVSHPGPLGTVVEAFARAGSREETEGHLPGRTWASGGGYDGPLVHRDGRPICPAVAAAFDRMDAAAQTAGVDLVVISGFRSDAEQAELFRRRPDPRWVAPPGRSRHREATELDIAGTNGAWRWLAANAGRFGFVQRYSWEPWHWGYVAGCRSARGRSGRALAARDEGLARAAAKANVVLLEDPDFGGGRAQSAPAAVAAGLARNDPGYRRP